MLGRFSRYWKRIDILTPNAPDARPCTIHGNVFVHPADKHRILQPVFIQQKGNALFAQRDYQLVTSHDFGFFYNGIGAYRLLKDRNTPLVSEIHHIEGYPIASSIREKLWRFTAQHYIPFIAKRGAHFRVVNQTVAQDLRDLGVSDNKIHMIYSLYLDLELYRPQAVEKIYDILFVGRLAQNKGIMLLLEAVRKVTQYHPTITLAIRGEGGLKPQIDRFIQAHDLSENIIFLPRVDDSNQMPTLYSQAKMLVCASTVEGNPRVTIEAMACATPVISTRVGIMPDVIDDGDNGLLVDWSSEDLAQAIQHLLEDDTAYQQIAEAGRKSVLRFDADTMIERYAKAYHDIIEQNQKRPT
ncbi:MAG: hypothetical protein Phog2KO_38370 [Phototrophicaceae bacterium]